MQVVLEKEERGERRDGTHKKKKMIIIGAIGIHSKIVGYVWTPHIFSFLYQSIVFFDVGRW